MHPPPLSTPSFLFYISFRVRTQTYNSATSLTRLFLYGCNAASTSVATNFSTCCGARPMNVLGSSKPSSSAMMGAKNSVRRMRSIRSFDFPCFLTLSDAWCDRTPVFNRKEMLVKERGFGKGEKGEGGGTDGFLRGRLGGRGLWRRRP